MDLLWYSPRGEPLKEFAYDQRFKLYRTGELFDYRRDPLEQAPLGEVADAAAARAKLQAALDRFEGARPEGLPWPTNNNGKKSQPKPPKKR